MKSGYTTSAFIAAVGFSIGSLGAQPVITQEPQDKIAREGAPVAFSVAAQGTSPLRYQWKFNGGDIPNAVYRSLSFVATASRAGNYSVMVRDTAGNSSSSSPARLEVQKRPIILQQPRNQIVGEGTTATFDVTLNDSGPYNSVQWWHHSTQEPHHPIPPTAAGGVNTFHLEIDNTSNNGTYNGLYWIVVANNAGTAISRRASLNVIGPPRLTSEPQDRIVRRGGTAAFSISIAPDAAGAKSKQWYKDGEPLPGKTGRVLGLVNVQPDSQGLYYCVVSSLGGTTSSYGATLTVR
jgi:hypothetical protein